MLNSKSLNGFMVNHCTTLIPEPNSDLFFIKVPVTSYNEVGIIRTNLLSAIDLIARYIETCNCSQRSEITHTINTLVQLSRSFELEEELDGLTEILKNRPS
ncbi:hypothetical protein [Crocinitomix algicola]|uniref:hypothetical protein n=1 Tax=Crocinitomix algicola TaxID=1740263 RepID=UPI00082E0A6C|nr:hypothetical protein [Crocinitomix algicola]